MSWHRLAGRDKLLNRCDRPRPAEVSLSRSRTRRRVFALLLGIMALAATACEGAGHPQNSLNPQGPEARYIDHLFWPVFWIAVAIFCLVAGLTLTIIFRYRMRPGNEAPHQIHGNTRLEVFWTIVPFLLLVVVGALSVIGVFHLYEKPTGPRITFTPASATSAPTVQGDVLEVHVVGHRWWWEFDYPGLGTMQDQFLTAGEQPNTALVTAGELHIPAGKKVYLDITSNEPAKSPEGVGPGVIHNFWVPQLAGKIYAEPGHITHLNLEADLSKVSDGHPVTYSGQCSEFCGISHANMRIKVVAETPSDFAAWVAEQQQVQHAPADNQQFTTPDIYAGFKLFNGSAGCSGCHTVQGTTAAGQVGPNLTHLWARGYFAGDIFQLTNNNLRVWLRDPQAAKPGANMRIRKLSEDEITQLIAYLDTLK